MVDIGHRNKQYKGETTYLCRIYVECRPDIPTLTRPGIGIELSIITPLDDDMLQSCARLQHSTVA